VADRRAKAIGCRGRKAGKQGPKRLETRKRKITQKTTPVPCIKTGGRKVSGGERKLRSDVKKKTGGKMIT